MSGKTKEVVYSVAKGVAGTVPVAGPILSELFGVAFTDPASKRREEILLEMDQRLKTLEEKGINVSELADNEEFLTIALQAYSIALKTHQADKRRALMNSISNTPGLGIDENEKLMFLNYIDQFNEWHLRLLAFLNSPESYFTVENRPNLFSGGISTLLVEAFPELRDRRGFYDQIARDLKNRDLIIYDSLHTTLSANGLWQSSTTGAGKRFLEFISE